MTAKKESKGKTKDSKALPEKAAKGLIAADKSSDKKKKSILDKTTLADVQGFVASVQEFVNSVVSPGQVVSSSPAEVKPESPPDPVVSEQASTEVASALISDPEPPKPDIQSALSKELERIYDALGGGDDVEIWPPKFSVSAAVEHLVNLRSSEKVSSAARSATDTKTINELTAQIQAFRQLVDESKARNTSLNDQVKALSDQVKELQGTNQRLDADLKVAVSRGESNVAIERQAADSRVAAAQRAGEAKAAAEKAAKDTVVAEMTASIEQEKKRSEDLSVELNKAKFNLELTNAALEGERSRAGRLEAALAEAQSESVIAIARRLKNSIRSRLPFGRS